MIASVESPHNQKAAPFGRLVNEFDGPLGPPDNKLAQGLGSSNTVDQFGLAEANGDSAHTRNKIKIIRRIPPWIPHMCPPGEAVGLPRAVQ